MPSSAETELISPAAELAADGSVEGGRVELLLVMACCLFLFFRTEALTHFSPYRDKNGAHRTSRAIEIGE